MNWSRFTVNIGKDVDESLIRQKSLFSLENMSDFVIEEMKNIPDLSELHIGGLSQIPLGKLRINAVRLHAVCRYKKGVRKTDQISPVSVKCIDIHPLALNDKWAKYANFLLFHHELPLPYYKIRQDELLSLKGLLNFPIFQ